MSHPPRIDSPNSWHHVMNRGIARRTLFESEADIRVFLSRLACAVRDGRIEVHAYCILTTHFHLLLRSPSGELSSVMQRVQNEYARWFNRGRQRDGPLFRGRFRSKPVDTLTYRFLLVEYIDANPVGAGLVSAPALYPHGSAIWYARDRGPPWLERDWIEGCVRAAQRSTAYPPANYARVFAQPSSPQRLRLVERRLRHAGAGVDPLDDLLGCAVDEVHGWMRRKAMLADGTAIGLPVCAIEDVETVLGAARAEVPAWNVRLARNSTCAWPQVHVGLLRDLCGATLAEAGTRTNRTLASTWTLEARHRKSMAECDEYGARVAELARRALDRCHPRGQV